MVSTNELFNSSICFSYIRSASLTENMNESSTKRDVIITFQQFERGTRFMTAYYYLYRVLTVY